MKLFLATDTNVIYCNKHYYFASQYYTILKRYFDKFGKITLYVRLKNTEEIDETQVLADDIIEKVIPISNLSETLLKKNREQLSTEIKNCDLVVGRLPSFAAYNAYDYARKANIPYMSESMACAWDTMWYHGIIGKLMAPYSFVRMKQVVGNSKYAIYVSNRFLQKRYPAKCESVAASNVNIKIFNDDVLKNRLHKIDLTDFKKIKVVTTGAIDVKYKGQEYMIRAIPMLNKSGIEVEYNLIGGKDKARLEKIAKNCGVSNQVKFLGRMPLDDVLSVIDECDLYVQPSLTEGMPRSVIEAMSRGCPVIGANTGGTLELLSKECLVKKKSPSDIARVISEIYNSTAIKEYAKINFETAKQYTDEILSKKRNQYYDNILRDFV